MKKLIVAAAIVCAAVASYAGSANWSVLDVTSPTSGYAYLFNADTVDYVDVSTVIASITAGTFADTYVANAVADDVIDGGELEVLKAYTGSGATTFWMIAVDDASDIKNVFVGEEVVVTLPTSTAARPVEWIYADNTSAWTAVGGSSVPEPTSGLLMLLGVAGLALRRKRA